MTETRNKENNDHLGDREEMIARYRAVQAELAEANRNAREAVAQFMLTRSIPTGHGDTLADLLGELGRFISDSVRQLDFAQSEIVKATDLYEKTVIDRNESDAVREKLADILSRTAVALKGPEGPLMRHSYHDLPEVAAARVSYAEQRFADGLRRARGMCFDEMVEEVGPGDDIYNRAIRDCLDAIDAALAKNPASAAEAEKGKAVATVDLANSGAVAQVPGSGPAGSGSGVHEIGVPQVGPGDLGGIALGGDEALHDAGKDGIAFTRDNALVRYLTNFEEQFVRAAFAAGERRGKERNGVGTGQRVWLNRITRGEFAGCLRGFVHDSRQEAVEGRESDSDVQVEFCECLSQGTSPEVKP